MIRQKPETTEEPKDASMYCKSCARFTFAIPEGKTVGIFDTPPTANHGWCPGSISTPPRVVHAESMRCGWWLRLHREPD